MLLTLGVIVLVALVAAAFGVRVVRELGWA